MVFPRATPSGKPSSLGETFRHVTHTGMAYLYNVTIGAAMLQYWGVFWILVQATGSSNLDKLCWSLTPLRDYLRIQKLYLFNFSSSIMQIFLYLIDRTIQESIYSV